MHTQQQFAQLILQHQKIIYKVCNLYVDNKTDKEDLYQEICLQAWKSYHLFRGEAKFSTWLYRIALNTAITYIKKEIKSVKTVFSESLPDFYFEDDNTKDQFKAMYKAINNLSKIDKALVLLYLEDLSYSEIAETLGITANNVAVKMNRIKIKLKDEAEKNLNN